MLNIPELERKWLIYKLKRILPAFIVISIALSAFIVFMFISPLQLNLSSTIPTKTKLTTEVDKTVLTDQIEHKVMKKEAITVLEQPPEPVSSKKPTRLEPSFNFMYDIEEEVLSFYDKPEEKPSPPNKQFKPQVKPQPVSKRGPTVSTPPAETRQSISVKQIGKQNPAVLSQKSTQKDETVPAKKDMRISHHRDISDIQGVIKRFKKNKNPALSLFVAKRYYSIGNYQQSYNYALMTNELNSEIEDSWMIFAKSLVKLDQKEMAIKTLNTYIEESQSINAKILLESIQKGTFQ